VSLKIASVFNHTAPRGVKRAGLRMRASNVLRQGQRFIDGVQTILLARHFVLRQ